MTSGEPLTFALMAAVAGGGALGSTLRFLLGRAISRGSGLGSAPLATLTVNVVGCFAAGVLLGLLHERWQPAPVGRAFWMVGVLGGFTTFSGFGVDTWELMRRGETPMAWLYGIATPLLAVAGVGVGMFLGSRWGRGEG